MTPEPGWLLKSCEEVEQWGRSYNILQGLTLTAQDVDHLEAMAERWGMTAAQALREILRRHREDGDS